MKNVVDKSPVQAETIPLFIGGQLVRSESTRTGQVTNPATGKVIRYVPMANAADINAAVSAGQKALHGWRATPALRRARVIQKFLTLLQANVNGVARLISEEHGKTLGDAIGSVERGIEVVEFACGIPHLLKGEYSENVGAGVDCYTLRQWACVQGLRRLTFPLWCRSGCFRWPSHAVTHSS